MLLNHCLVKNDTTCRVSSELSENGEDVVNEALSNSVVQRSLYDTVGYIILHVPFTQRSGAEAAELRKCLEEKSKHNSLSNKNKHFFRQSRIHSRYFFL